MTAVLDAHRRYQLVVRLPLPAYRRVGQCVEREDIVMRLTGTWRTWATIPRKAKVVLPLSGLRQGGGVQRRRTPRNVVHDPVVSNPHMTAGACPQHHRSSVRASGLTDG